MMCIPPAISGVVDADDGGAVRLRTDPTPPAAVLVVSDTKFAAWKSMFPAGLNKAVESKYNKTRRLWFVMTGIPADAPTDSRIINTTEGVSVFWSGFRVPIDAGEWQPDPPETLPEVSYADIMRLMGLPTSEPAGPAPEPAPFDGTAIPQEMKKRNQWLCWQFGERDGKTTKIPINPETYGFAKAPEANWSYETCRKAMAAGYRGFVGIGFSLRNGIIGVDFDHVLDERGQLISEYAHLESIVDKIKSYTEMSPSGTGFHIYFRCDSIPPACKQAENGRET